MKTVKVPKSPIRCSPSELVSSRFRQVHLDFHTSELIGDVGVGFEAEAFADRLAEARVDWVTLFAKCHHGMSYYPTKVGTVHPALKFDLLGSQIEACRRRGIVTPAYISVRVDEHNARRHPDWVVRMKNGTAWKWGAPLEAGWYQLCLNNAEYIEQLAAQAVEVLRAYDVEGLMWDMCYAAPGCYCPRCYDGMKRRGLDFTSDADHRKFESLTARAYTQKLARAVRGIRKNATLFFNGRMRPGVRDELDVFTHLEIEALPTGGWGYAFFPVHVRYARVLGRAVQGMTARFHRSWGDFGGLKTVDQLMYEAGTILAAGAVISVGDQLHPRGEFDRGAYQVIGEVYRHVEACEPWCRAARPETEIAVLMLPEAGARSPEDAPTAPSANLSPAVDGAGRMLLELKHQFDLVYPDTDLDRYRVVILPDRGQLDASLTARLKRYLADGGHVLASYRAGLEGDCFKLPVPVRVSGEHPSRPSYFELGSALGKGIPDSRFVFYGPSLHVEPRRGATTYGRLWTTYFDRAYDHFCSHGQTPYDRRTRGSVVVVKGRLAYLSPAVFEAYREHAYYVYKEVVARVLEQLLPEPLLRTDAPSGMEVSLLRQRRPNRLVVHLVNFQPQRRHASVEWIERLYPVRDIPLSVRTGRAPRSAYVAPSKREVPFQMHGAYCSVVIPEVRAHQMVVFEGSGLGPTG